MLIKDQQLRISGKFLTRESKNLSIEPYLSSESYESQRVIDSTRKLITHMKYYIIMFRQGQQAQVLATTSNFEPQSRVPTTRKST